MSVRSMTGFARVKKTTSAGEVACGIKSVNHRGLDLQFQLPPSLEAAEADFRAAVKNGVARGHLQIRVSFGEQAAAAGAPVVNRPLLDAYVRVFHEASRQYGIEGEPDLNSALRLSGMWMAAGESEPSAEILSAALEVVRDAVVALNQFREREGAVIAAEILERCRGIQDSVDRMEQFRAGAAPAFQKRLRERLTDLLNGAAIEPQRLAQEAAILADRSDISEELTRLRTHTAQLESAIKAGGEVGKRLDFLLQEMNREANTTLSKTGGLGDLGLTMTELALAAKSEIEKIREQALNLE